MKKMTMRERMLAVLQGKEHDKMPFTQYDNLIIPNELMWSTFGRENAGVLQRTKVTKLVNTKCSITSYDITEKGYKGKISTMHTPKGELHEKIIFDPYLNSPARVEHFVKKPDDYNLLLEYFRDITVHEDMQRYQGHLAYLDGAGLPMACLARTPYQQMWIFWVSLMDFCVDLYEHADIVEACMDCLAKVIVNELKIIAQAAKKIDIPLVNFGDNITAPIIGPEYFQKYCIYYYDLAAEIFDNKNMIITVHTDGDLKPLAELIAGSKIGGLDSFTPKPDNDTGLDEALEMWPNIKMLMNFPSSLHLADKDIIYKTAVELLQQTKRSGRVWMQISEDLPPGMWEKSFPAILQAIDEYGPPMG
jgi:hypothetical protein